MCPTSLYLLKQCFWDLSKFFVDTIMVKMHHWFTHNSTKMNRKTTMYSQNFFTMACLTCKFWALSISIIHNLSRSRNTKITMKILSITANFFQRFPGSGPSSIVKTSTRWGWISIELWSIGKLTWLWSTKITDIVSQRIKICRDDYETPLLPRTCVVSGSTA